MRKSVKRKTGQGKTVMLCLFLLVLVCLAGMLVLRMNAADRVPAFEAESIPAPGAEETREPEAQMEKKTPETVEQTDAQKVEPAVDQVPSASADPMPESIAEPAGSMPVRTAVYTAETYQLVTDMVFTMRREGESGERVIRALLEELKAEDPELGDLWEDIMNYWLSVSGDFIVNVGALPNGLPEDNSLCITVLGFQLMHDGEMAPELVGRCEIALAAAQQYPNAFVLVTGGGTASGNREATEAGVMADWLSARGVSPERIIVEDRSLTTDQNASLSCKILSEQYPQIREMAIVSSDYHVALGSMLFTEAALLYGYRHSCEAPYTVVSNAGFATSGNPEYSNPRNFAGDIWIMADPTY